MYPDAPRTPTESLAKVTFLIYILHLFSALNGLLSPAFIITAFLTGWPSIIALIMSYIWRGDAANTYLGSHFTWLISTFWYALLWLIIAWVFIFTVIGMVVGIPLMLLVGVWVLYRLGKGMIALNARKMVF